MNMVGVQTGQANHDAHVGKKPGKAKDLKQTRICLYNSEITKLMVLLDFFIYR